MVCDGLSREWITQQCTPNLMRLQTLGLVCDQHQAVFPSVTRVSAASIATGCYPGSHGLHGNQMALLSQENLTVHNVGLTGFRSAMRAATGTTLKVPTMAQYLSAHAGQSVYSNVSPGAAYFLDPEHYGTVYHRSGSFSKGGASITGTKHLNVSHDLAGDQAMTARFCTDLEQGQAEPLSILWLANPDLTLHYHAPGSAEHLQALKQTDDLVGVVFEKIQQLRATRNILLAVCSDHGHEVIGSSVHIGTWLAAQGLAAELDQGQIAVAGQGTSALLYATSSGRKALAPLLKTLAAQEWVAQLISSESELGKVGLGKIEGLVAAIDMARSETINQHGVVGARWMVEDGETSVEIGCGQHGGLGPQETRPFCMLNHSSCLPQVLAQPTSLVDLAPTLLEFLQIPFAAMDGQSIFRHLQ